MLLKHVHLFHSSSLYESMYLSINLLKCSLSMFICFIPVLYMNQCIYLLTCWSAVWACSFASFQFSIWINVSIYQPVEVLLEHVHLLHSSSPQQQLLQPHNPKHIFTKIIKKSTEIQKLYWFPHYSMSQSLHHRKIKYLI